MRISDWSSDVCSSDDDHHRGHHRLAAVGPHHFPGLGLNLPDELDRGRFRHVRCSSNETEKGTWPGRSEEHTSELQSLMRNSYAVFCLKKTKQNIIVNSTRMI